MTESKKELPLITTFITLVLVLLGSDWIFSIIDIEYNMWSDPFDFIKLFIKFITIYILYFIGIKFFSWLYSESPQKNEK
jgi:hypothetical protein